MSIVCGQFGGSSSSAKLEPDYTSRLQAYLFKVAPTGTSTATAIPAPTSTPVPHRSVTIDANVCIYTDWDCVTATRVEGCESGGNPTAYNAGSIGLFQINYSAHYDIVGPDSSVLYDPGFNIKIAHTLWLDQGWYPWRYSQSCWG